MAQFVASVVARVVIAIAAAMVAIAGVVTASGFLIGALYLYLRSLPLAPALAALIVAVVLLAVAGLVLLAARLATSRRPRLRLPRLTGDGHDGAINSIAEELGTRVGREAPAAAAEHPYGVVSLAFLGGLALGGSPALQQIVIAALKATDGGAGRQAAAADPNFNRR